MRTRDKILAENNYKLFCSYQGSKWIASEFALDTILRLIRSFQIKDILELGVGIGSVSDTVLKSVKRDNKEINYYGTESNDFCLSVLPKYVEDFEKIRLFSELKDIENKTFDFVIIDGLDDSLSKIKSYLGKNAILYVEGDRKVQTKTLLSMFPKHKYVNVITLKKNPPYAHENRSINNYIGGGQLIFTNPTLTMKFFWFKEKVSTALKIRIRKLR